VTNETNYAKTTVDGCRSSTPWTDFSFDFRTFRYDARFKNRVKIRFFSFAYDARDGIVFIEKHFALRGPAGLYTGYAYLRVYFGLRGLLYVKTTKNVVDKNRTHIFGTTTVRARARRSRARPHVRRREIFRLFSFTWPGWRRHTIPFPRRIRGVRNSFASLLFYWQRNRFPITSVARTRGTIIIIIIIMVMAISSNGPLFPRVRRPCPNYVTRARPVGVGGGGTRSRGPTHRIRDRASCS